MFTVWGTKAKGFCDGIGRRDFLKAGTLGVAGLTLADILR
ncbi:twin-arginine translocation signal domain-containing protein, partial [Klebsiella pneumoniae]